MKGVWLKTNTSTGSTRNTYTAMNNNGCREAPTKGRRWKEEKKEKRGGVGWGVGGVGARYCAPKKRSTLPVLEDMVTTPL